ncbi:MAG: MFS transporter [Proteobacteria bacterium]|jgi:ATP:ADP antiporter, AAA family|nr:MFS transporter [Pseudomonadota bacterium]
MPESPQHSITLARWLERLVNVEPHEVRALFWSFSYFFVLLCSYYILRPMRDEMGVAGGVENLQWLFTGTFLVMLAIVPLFGWLTSRYQRRRFMPAIYYFFSFNLLLFYLLFKIHLDDVFVARVFFIWTSVFNLFVVSVFWSFMVDIYSNAQARRLFGFIAAGGTAGALAGPALTASLAVPLGPANLLLISAGLLLWAVVCIQRLSHWQCQQPAAEQDTAARSSESMGGGIYAGIRLLFSSPYLLGIAGLMLLFTTLSTFLYFQQAQIVRDSFASGAERTAVFAAIDLAVNSLTILLQVFITGRLVKWIGLAWTLAMVPLLLCVGFVSLALAPVLAVLVVVQVIRRAGNYAITRPAREMLYVVLDREQKYKAKNVNDTVIYRGGDAVSAWLYAGLRSLGLGLSGLAWVAVPLAMLWAWAAYRLGRQQTIIASQHKLS